MIRDQAAGAHQDGASEDRIRRVAEAGAIRIAIGFPPGVVTHKIAQVLAEALPPATSLAGEIVERVGAGGRIAIDFVKRTDDDQTVLLTPGSTMWVFPHVFNRLSYTPHVDFAPVAGIGTLDYAIAVSAHLGRQVGTLHDYVKWCGEASDRLRYGVPASGSMPHFIGTELARCSRRPLSAVFYKGGAPLVRDVVAGRIPLAIQPLPDVADLHVSGGLRILATTGHQRWPKLHDVPTVAEAGFEELSANGWYGLYAPAHVSRARIQQLQHALLAAAAHAFDRLTAIQVTPQFLDADTFRALNLSETGRWKDVVHASGMRATD